MHNNPIGIFDSGIGGLTVTREIVRKLPHESIIYLGDTARVPYGGRSKEAVTQFAKELVNFLLKRKVKALVVACNTVSATCLEEIEKMSPVPVIGVVKPASKRASEVTKNKKIGVIGTMVTIKSKSYEKELKKLDPKIAAISYSCPLFVPLAEEGLSRHKATKLIAEDYLEGIVESDVDTLILGCTHYPILFKTISDVIGKKVTLVDSAQPTVLELKEILQKNDLISDNTKPTYRFYVTDAPERVSKVASRFFGKGLEGKIRKINLEDELDVVVK